jgi:hypothetical protein
MTPWRTSPKSWKNRHPKQQRKIKISWQRLGLRDPAEEKAPVPIEEMRRQVDVVAREGLMRGVRSYPAAPGAPGSEGARRRSRGKKD